MNEDIAVAYELDHAEKRRLRQARNALEAVLEDELTVRELRPMPPAVITDLIEQLQKAEDRIVRRWD